MAFFDRLEQISDRIDGYVAHQNKIFILFGLSGLILRLLPFKRASSLAFLQWKLISGLNLSPLPDNLDRFTHDAETFYRYVNAVRLGCDIALYNRYKYFWLPAK